MTMAKKKAVPNGVRLVVADVDGTLVTPDKVLTPRAGAVVRAIIEESPLRSPAAALHLA